MKKRLIITLFIFQWFTGFTQNLDLAEFSLQDLIDQKVTLVSKKEEKFIRAAAAVFVLTNEDIRRSGATSIPELLRLVPGFQVARIDANKWAVSTRGFIGRFSNKLLVLIDGRSVYSPLFSGVFWSMQDVMLEDIERIEVIRGPGATLWGANAVNGIINIVTKHTKETQGGLISVGVGTEERIFGTARYGTEISKNVSIRGFSKYIKRDQSLLINGDPAADDWDILHNGLRADWEKSPNHLMSLESDFYCGNLNHTLETVTLDPPHMNSRKYNGDMRGMHVQFHSQSIFNNASVLNLQTYYDYLNRDEGVVNGSMRTFNIDLDYLFDWGRRHQVICGAAFRLIRHEYAYNNIMYIDSNVRTQNLYSAFIQDDIQILKERLRLTLGSKFEHYYYTGFEIQPNARLLFTPNTVHTFWTAVSKAVRTPSLAEVEGRHLASMDGTMLFDLPMIFGYWGNPDLRSESLIAYEIGYRHCPSNQFLLDVAAFYNDYNHLVSGNMGFIEIDPSPYPQYYIFYATSENKIAGQIYGVETLLDYQVSKTWRIQCSYTFSKANMHYVSGGNGLYINQVDNIEGQIPRHQGFLRSSMNLLKNIELDACLRYMDELPELSISDYFDLDLRLGLQISRQYQLSIIGQNLLHEHRLEFVPELSYSKNAMIQRGIFVKFNWLFNQTNHK
ncbi:TonB-dependent receptor [candidate division KSB1 bacterium]|nr:TonB-dependent receptor [candidate division KSB1 bacterium]